MKTFDRIENKIRSAKTEFLFVLFTLLSTYPVMAQGAMPAKMKTLVDSILAIFTGPVIKTILIIMLAACAVAYGFNKDNEKIKRNILAIAVATAILVASTFIVGLVWGSGSSATLWTA
jgi:type IV secretory pathway VirB2 component (pilin)